MRFFRYLIIFILFATNNILSKDYIVIQSTTSTVNTGLMDMLSDYFKKETGIDVRTIAVGTGTAISNAKNGDSDILLVHSEIDELLFVEEGYGVERHELMYNDFVLVGPNDDPAKISNAQNLKDVMGKLHLSEFKFVSRDDNSGTHKKELSLWKNYEISPREDKNYIKTGAGMANTLNIASEMKAYTLTDRGTWISFQNKKNLKILYEKDKSLYNPYGIIALSPKMFPHVEYEKSLKFINWLINGNGRDLIENFKIDGKKLFFVNK